MKIWKNLNVYAQDTRCHLDNQNEMFDCPVNDYCEAEITESAQNVNCDQSEGPLKDNPVEATSTSIKAQCWKTKKGLNFS